MARIPESELSRIKEQVSVLDRVRGGGVSLKRHGSDWIGLCPFHEDVNPSLVVTPSKNLWHCMGTCQTGGSVIDWVMKVEGVSFRHAVELLRRELPESRKPSVHLDASMDDVSLLKAVVGYYHETLLGSDEAIRYLEKRGLNHRTAIEHFKLGFSNRTLTYQLPDGKEGQELRKRLQELGVFRGSGHEHLNGSLVVPVFDEAGNVSELYGRKIRDDLRKGTPVHLYLPGPHRGVWNLEALKESKEIILCEALLDALTFWTAGFRNVTASFGIEGVTQDHIEAFRTHGTERVLIAYDRDDAGEQAAEKLAQRLAREGLRCYRIQFPRGMDANSYALENTPADKALELSIRNAVFLGQAAAVPRAAKEEKVSASLPAEPTPAEPIPPTPSPEPQAAHPDVPVKIDGDDVTITIGDRQYRVRGLPRNTSPDVMKVNLLVRRGEGVHVDTLDLYAARPRAAFVSQAAAELKVTPDVVKKDLGTVLLKCEVLKAEGAFDRKSDEQTVSLSDPEREAALSLLRHPNLLDMILGDFDRVGVVGEETNKLVGYLAALSRKLPEPLAVIVQSASAAGKTSLMEAVLSFVPPEERVQYSAVTGQALFYMNDTDLKHKILSVVEEEGAERASYALKLLQSEGELTIASTGKDPQTGKLVTHAYRVEGPVMIFLTTTAVEVDEELINRALLLSVDEDRAQTRAIHARQRERRTLEGLFARAERDELLTLHRNAQRLLDAIAVVNPYAPQLTFLDVKTRTRRDHEKYMTLIDTVTLLHQHQREQRTLERDGKTLTYIEVTKEDIRVANKLAALVLGHSLDELPPQTRRFLTKLDEWIKAQCEFHQVERDAIRFLARDAREITGLGATQVKLHLRRLIDLEYILVHRADRGHGVAYELLYGGEGEDGKRFLPGLLDVETLRDPYDPKRSGGNGKRSEVGRPSVGARSGGGRTSEKASISITHMPLDDERSVLAEMHI